MKETWNFNWVLFTRIHNDHGIPRIYASLRQYIKHFSGSFHVAHIYMLEETGQEHDECMGFGKWVLCVYRLRGEVLDALRREANESYVVTVELVYSC